MRLLEHQAKDLFAAAGISVPPGRLADSPEQASEIAAELGGRVMVKAQVRAGGRGKAGGILAAGDPLEAGQAARRLLDSEIAGLPVRRVLVEQALRIERELYLGLTLDYDQARSVLLIGRQGGVEVEQHAEQPGVLGRAPLRPGFDLPAYLVRDTARRAGLEPSLAAALVPIAQRLSRLFLERDALLAEINPLALTPDGQLVAADARLTVDDAALGRQPDLARLAAEAPDETLEERIKREHDFDFLILDPNGDVGLVGTGAGGTMMTLDLIEQAGGRPFNFADVRTGRLLGDPTRLILVLRELAQAPSVRSVLISVFGAVTDLEAFAQTLCLALDAEPLTHPAFVRVQGYKAAEAQAILRARGLLCFDDLEEAVATTVTAARPEGAWRS
jgi:succinyl-CoA synthetase beta subunit